MTGETASHRQCDWCGVFMGITESEDYHLENGEKVYCCFFCRQYASKEDMELQKQTIIILAINPENSAYLKYPWI